MGLDVYAGSLTRYYSGDWETIIERTCRENGVPCQVIRVPPTPPDEALDDPQKIHESILVWRDWISGKLAEEGERPLEWVERAEAPYDTDNPGWDAYGNLLVWAAREEHPRWFTQKTIGDDWPKDRSYRRSLRKGAKSRYAQLITGPEIWLPANFTGVIDAIGPTGTEMRLGSLGQLRAQLDLLNDRTWRADAPTIATWRQRGPVDQGPVEELAQFGFALFDHLTTFAIEQRVPLKLDY